jgi:hypothetical protein
MPENSQNGHPGRHAEPGPRHPAHAEAQAEAHGEQHVRAEGRRYEKVAHQEQA